MDPAETFAPPGAVVVARLELLDRSVFAGCFVFGTEILQH
jgi:hypothetical protein